MKYSDSLKILENFFRKSISLRYQIIVSFFVSLIGLGLTYFAFQLHHFYFTSITILPVIIIALYSNIFVAIIYSFLIALVADYFFVPPIGAVLSSVEGIEHLAIRLIIAIITVTLGSFIRNLFAQVVSAKQEAERAKQEAERAKQEAERAKDLMEKVLALVSHDIRNPLSAISTSAQLILRTPGQTEKHHSILVRMLRSLEQADGMIQSLLDVARMRAGKALPVELQNCDLTIQIRQIVEDMSLTECNRLRFAGAEPIWGAWGVAGLRRVLQNLVTNGVKYGDPNSPILISLKRLNERAVLEVHNDGPEIPPDDQKGLFEAFQRTRDSESGNIRGWGLGLALVKGIAEAHDGTVKIESARNAGTTFTLNLPIRKME